MALSSFGPSSAWASPSLATESSSLQASSRTDQKPMLQVRTRFLEVLKIPIIPTGLSIGNPRFTQSAQLVLTPRGGHWPSPPQLLPNNRRQKVLSQESTSIHLQLESLPPANPLASFPVPYEDKRYLGATPYLEIYHPTLETLAKGVTSKEKRAWAAAQKLRQWVHDAIETDRQAVKEPSGGVSNPTGTFQSALTTFKKKSGNAAEQATLLAALCRAIGVPSRLVSGLVYYPSRSKWRLGQYRYHTWSEVYIGDTQWGEWVPLDPVFEEMETDATHLALARTPMVTQDSPEELMAQVSHFMAHTQLFIQETHAKANSGIDLASRGSSPITLANLLPTLDITQLDIAQQTIASTGYYSIGESPLQSLGGQSFTRGVSLLTQGKIEEAQKIFHEATLAQTDPLEQLALGKKLTRIEMYNLAKRAFTAAATQPSLKHEATQWLTFSIPATLLAPEQEQTYQAALHALEVLDNAPKAQGLLSALLLEQPSFFPAYLHLGEAHRKMEDYAQAQTAYHQFQQRRPKDPRGPLGLASVAMAQKDYALALQQIQQAFNLSSRWSDPQARSMTTHLESQRSLLQALSTLHHHPNHPTGWTYLGIALFQRNEPYHALKAFNRALTHRSHDPRALTYKFQIHLDLLDWEGLETLFPKVVTFSHQSAQAARLLGAYHMTQRQYAQAESKLKQAIAMDPHHPQGYQLLGQVQTLSGQSQAAQQTYERGLKHLDTTARSSYQGQHLLFAYGDHVLTQGTLNQDSQSLLTEYLNTLAQEDPSSAPTYLLQGELALRQGHLQHAKERLHRGLSLAPNNPKAFTMLGQAYSREGHDGKAINYYFQALEIEEDFPLAAQALTRLIHQTQWQLPKPKLYEPITPDEKFYMVQVFRMEAKAKEDEAGLYQHLNALMANAGTHTLNSIYERSKTRDVLNEFYNRTHARYDHLVGMSGQPPRFKRLHALLVNQVRSHLGVVNVMLKTLPFIYDEKHLAVSRSLLKLAMKKQGLIDESIQHELGRFHIQPVVLRSTKAEAGWLDSIDGKARIARQQFFSNLKKSAAKPAKQPPGKATRKGNKGKISGKRR